MHLAPFLQDLALMMIMAGIVTVIFHRLKQPVVLGYIMAGVILGPHTPPFSFIQDETVVRTLAELGVIFLMFSLGLEFSISRLIRTGMVAFVGAAAGIVFMILLGYETGRLFGWKSIDSLFLGSMLAISSTTIIVRALHELKMRKAAFARTIYGILIIEDILAIGILTLLSGMTTGGSVNVSGMIITLGKLLVFLISSPVIGILLVPRLLAYIARFKSREMLLVTVLGLCFGFSLLVIRLGYSVALGAFLMGAIIAQSHQIRLIEKLVRPLTSMFSAIFFVSIGLLVDPSVMTAYFVPIVVLTLAVVIGKVLVCSLAVFLTGQDGKTSLRIGMGLAQIGEFSFIIATLGITLGLTGSFLYPVIVAVSAITTFLTPYLLRMADPLAHFLGKIMPSGISEVFASYTLWLQNIRSADTGPVTGAMKKGFLHIFINLMLVVAIFIVGSFVSYSMGDSLSFVADLRTQKALIWGGCLVISLPLLIAIYRKSKALSLILTDMAMKTQDYNLGTRRILSEIIPAASMVGIVFMIVALSAGILPPFGLLILVLVIVVTLAAVLWRWFVRLHTRLQLAFIQTFERADQGQNSGSS